jgi:hypothetical protein
LNLLAETARQPFGVCPPFPLRDEAGQIINPAADPKVNVPYSPKQTCGAPGCHDYDKITQGFHFQQGRGEKPPKQFTARYQWASSPGNYGGNWCSPAPLYRQLAPKRNTNARTIDMTSFDFVTATCGNCHPGGGPLEYDRDGHRYDHRMRDPASGLTPGGDNGLDGDYFKARWSETGVIEADCLLCHQPAYNYKLRNDQLAALNFRWAATAGAGFGVATGSVGAGEKPQVVYHRALFDDRGNVTVHIAPAPRNETCLHCHAKPDWKKRGASFSAHTDVHLAKGLKCVDCHTSGSRASDPRIRGKEEHQIGKGDDPSGWVRNDLDNTVRACESCHAEGTLGAPIAKHAWLPPLHLDKIACATCHIPRRYTKAALVQASDVYNGAPRILPPPKRIWTFYDQDRAFWNHYGELDLFTAQDKPVNEFYPSLARYKGKIFPVDRVHSAWVGYEEPGKPGLNQLFMRDFYGMWLAHRNDPAQYPQLAEIRDDNGDGMIEVNRPEEIDALLNATAAHLEATGFPLAGRTLVYVANDRKYTAGNRLATLPKEPHEASPYASVYKYSHNVLPARAALGAKGCTDCHAYRAVFLYGRTLERPFDEAGQGIWRANHEAIGISRAQAWLGAFRETTLKPLLYLALCVLALLAAGLLARLLLVRLGSVPPAKARRAAWLLTVAGLFGLAVSAATPRLLAFMTFERFTLDANHFWVSVLVLAVSGLLAVALPGGPRRSILWASLAIAALSGALMLVIRWWPAFTIYDAAVVWLAGVLVFETAHALLAPTEKLESFGISSKVEI